MKRGKRKIGVIWIITIQNIEQQIWNFLLKICNDIHKKI